MSDDESVTAQQIDAAMDSLQSMADLAEWMTDRDDARSALHVLRQLRDLVHEIAVSGVEWDAAPRYLTVQIDCVTWSEIQLASGHRVSGDR